MEVPKSATVIAAGALITYLVTSESATASELWGLYPVPELIAAEPYRLFTHVFIHANLMHLTLNIATLLILGWLIERMLGLLNSVIIMTLSYVSSILFSVSVAPLGGLRTFSTPLIGASSIVAGLAAAYLVAAEAKNPAMKVLVLIWFLAQFPIYVMNASLSLVAHVAGFLGGASGYMLVSGYWRWRENLTQKLRYYTVYSAVRYMLIIITIVLTAIAVISPNTPVADDLLIYKVNLDIGNERFITYAFVFEGVSSSSEACTENVIGKVSQLKISEQGIRIVFIAFIGEALFKDGVLARLVASDQNLCGYIDYLEANLVTKSLLTFKNPIWITVSLITGLLGTLISYTLRTPKEIRLP